jgi:hypothetical protein
VQGSDTEFLAFDSNILGSQHGGIGGRLITISLDLHTTSNTDNGLATSQVSDVDKGIIVGGIDVGNTKDEFARTDLRSESNILFNLGFASFLQEGWMRIQREWYRSHSREFDQGSPGCDFCS